jgi:hypothetical protein
MCIALRLDKASKANTGEFECLEWRKASTKVVVVLTQYFQEENHCCNCPLVIYITRIQTRFKALGLNKTTHRCHRTTFT